MSNPFFQIKLNKKQTKEVKDHWSLHGEDGGAVLCQPVEQLATQPGSYETILNCWILDRQQAQNIQSLFDTKNSEQLGTPKQSKAAKN